MPATLAPPWHSLGAALIWTLGGLAFAAVGLAEQRADGTFAFGLGLSMFALGSVCLVGMYRTNLVAECRDLKERALGQRRTKYR